jgi:hypothetical protein
MVVDNLVVHSHTSTSFPPAGTIPLNVPLWKNYLKCFKCSQTHGNNTLHVGRKFLKSSDSDAWNALANACNNGPEGQSNPGQCFRTKLLDNSKSLMCRRVCAASKLQTFDDSSIILPILISKKSGNDFKSFL